MESCSYSYIILTIQKRDKIIRKSKETIVFTFINGFQEVPKPRLCFSLYEQFFNRRQHLVQNRCCSFLYRKISNSDGWKPISNKNRCNCGFIKSDYFIGYSNEF